MSDRKIREPKGFLQPQGSESVKHELVRANVAHLVPLINAIKSHTPIEAKGHFARIAPQHVLAEDFHLFQGGIHHRFSCSRAPYIGVGGHGAQAILLGIFEHEGATVMMAPAAGFYATEGLGRNQVRIAYVLELEALRHAVDCIAAGLREYQGAHQPA